MNTQKSRFAGLFETPDNQPATKPKGEQVVKPDRREETLEKRKQEFKKSRKEENGVSRVKTNYEIREDYVQALKRIAVDEKRKIYDVLEEAIGQYLEHDK